MCFLAHFRLFKITGIPNAYMEPKCVSGLLWPNFFFFSFLFCWKTKCKFYDIHVFCLDIRSVQFFFSSEQKNEEYRKLHSWSGPMLKFIVFYAELAHICELYFIQAMDMSVRSTSAWNHRAEIQTHAQCTLYDASRFGILNIEKNI